MPERNTMKKIQELQQVKGDAYDYYIAGNEDTDLVQIYQLYRGLRYRGELRDSRFRDFRHGQIDGGAIYYESKI